MSPHSWAFSAGKRSPKSANSRARARPINAAAARCAAVRHQTQSRKAQGEEGRTRRDHQIAHQGQAHAHAGRRAPSCGDDGKIGVAQPAQEGVISPLQHFAQIGAFAAAARQDWRRSKSRGLRRSGPRRETCIGIDQIHRLEATPHHGQGRGVDVFGMIEGQDGDASCAVT